MPNRHGDIRDTAGKRHQDGRQIEPPRGADTSGAQSGEVCPSSHRPLPRPRVRQPAALCRTCGLGVRYGTGGYPGHMVDHRLELDANANCAICGRATKVRFGQAMHEYGHYPDVPDR